MTQYTPGPWEAKSFKCSWRVRARGMNLAIMDSSCINQEDNARLVAAAPELLEANKLSLRNIDSMIYALPVGRSAERQSLETWAHIVRAAITKAEGSATP